MSLAVSFGGRCRASSQIRSTRSSLPMSLYGLLERGVQLRPEQANDVIGFIRTTVASILGRTQPLRSASNTVEASRLTTLRASSSSPRLMAPCGRRQPGTRGVWHHRSTCC